MEQLVKFFVRNLGKGGSELNVSSSSTIYVCNVEADYELLRASVRIIQKLSISHKDFMKAK